MLFARAAAVTLVAFDGAPGAVSKFAELNDPVMGGKSTGTWSVSSGVGVFDGEVMDVPSLKAPGFIKAAADGRFPDAQEALGGALVLEVRSSTPEYAGFRVSFAAGTLSPSYACSGGGQIPLSRGCYKAHFTVPAGGDFTKVRVPLSAFSDLWSPATGDAVKTCAQDSSACPTAKELAKILRLEFWAEGKLGKAHLEVKSVTAEGAADEVLAADACTYYRKVQDGACADACLDAKVGICPVGIITKTGGLEQGSCKDAGYTVADGSVDQKAGPCGTLHFDKYTKQAEEAAMLV